MSLRLKECVPRFPPACQHNPRIALEIYLDSKLGIYICSMLTGPAVCIERQQVR